ncbi:Retrovirus-related Pol poly from transposon [Paramuricea clavata]|uniref:Retrovirus-related Pol poly from transposon n=1 Tax=Paramuricea clavata TaxID=317549 RepID=A0A7D9JU16_PARCT|nr:Retrovirus-related Pol poly from transposon [Paramuricea clavata]
MLKRLQMYDLNVRYKRGTELYLADTLSRHYLTAVQETRETDVLNYLSDVEIEQGEHDEIMEINQLLASEDVANMYRDKTDQDEDLQVLKRVMQSGWTVVKNNLTAAVGYYFHIRDELVVQDGLILRGGRLVIPKAHRKTMMESLHASHRDRSDSQKGERNHQSKETLISHEIPDRPWGKIATDLFEFDGKVFGNSRLFLDRLYSTQAVSVIQKLKAHLARYSIPEKLISDQGPQFTSGEFKNFCASYGMKNTMTIPHYHQANGMAEAAVKQAKRVLKVAKISGRDPHLALLDLRNTPQEDSQSWGSRMDEATVLREAGIRSYEVEMGNDRTLIWNRRHLKEAKSRSANGDDQQQIQELPRTPEFAERGSSGFDGETDPIPELIPDPDRGA